MSPAWMTGILEVLMFLLPTLAMLIITRTTVPGARMTFKRIVLAAGMALTGYVVLTILGAPMVALWTLISPTLADSSQAVPNMVNADPLWVSMVTIALIPAITEELPFRGAIMKAYAQDPTRAVVISGLLFGMMHMQIERLHILFVLGMIIGWVVIRTGNVVYGMIMHAINNAVAVGLSSQLASWQEKLSQMAANTQPGPNQAAEMLGVLLIVCLAIVVCFALFALFWMLLRRDTKQHAAALDLQTVSMEKPKMGFFGGLWLWLAVTIMVAVMALPYIGAYIMM
jgi:membrane protease YdiL (CAAX protease family)